MTMKQLSVFVENKMGRMAEITQVIGDSGVDIRALSVADTSDFGILRLIVDKPDVAVKALKDAGMTVSLTDVLAVGIDDVPGSFAKAVKAVSDVGINIEYMYAFISRTDGKAYVILRVENIAKAVEVLEHSGIDLLRREDIFDLEQ